MSSPRSIRRAAARGNSRKRHVTESDTDSPLHGSPAPSRNLRKADPETISGRVYLASSLHTFDTPEYSKHLDTLAAILPDAEILPARGLFRSNSEWRRRWPDILPSLDALIYFEDRDGYIGYGVYSEISDALGFGIPVRHLTPDGRLYEIATEDDGEPVVTAFHPFDWQQFAQVAYVVRTTNADDLAAFLDRRDERKAGKP